MEASVRRCGFHDHGIYDPFGSRHNSAHRNGSGAESVQVVLFVLVVVGALAVMSFGVRLVMTLRVLRAANLFQATSVEAITAIHQTPSDELRQLRAIQAWEGARAVIRRLTDHEQRIVAETLRDRSFPTAEVGEALDDFVAAMGRSRAALDNDLAEMMRPATSVPSV
jgi:hypothetical protein